MGVSDLGKTGRNSEVEVDMVEGSGNPAQTNRIATHGARRPPDSGRTDGKSL